MKKILCSALFACCVSGVSAQLWPVQPVLLKDIAPGITRGVRFLSPYPADNRLIFSASLNNVGDNMLWASDGTTAGTNMIPVVTGATGNITPDNFFQWNGNQYHAAAYQGMNLYKTGAVNQDSIGKLYETSSANVRVAIDSMGSTLYYLFIDPFVGGVFATTGPGNRTQLASPGPQLIGNSIGAAGGKIYYQAVSPGAGNELWATDVTTNTHALVKDIHPAGSSDPEFLGKLGNKILFAATDVINGRELWVSDGTAAGTVLLADCNAGDLSGDPARLMVWNNKAYFTAKINSTQNSTLWSTDGTPGGTAEVWGRSGSTLLGTISNVPINMGSFLIFQGNDTAGRELWRTDGTNAGTFRFKDLRPYNGINQGSMLSGALIQQNVIDGRLYFHASDSSLNDQELWVTDGTDTGTHLVCNLFPGTSNARGVSSDALAVCKYDGRIYFVGNNGQTGFEVFSFPAPPPVSPVTGIAAFPTAGQTLRLFPNPTTGVVTIGELEESDVVVTTDVAGRVIRHSHRSGMVDISSLVPGNYTLSVIRNGRLTGSARVTRL
ncbi:MAG: hypothetical protein EOP49_01370 [Sphingobacteriales bacterium]|nr:MAG: hypothetical protein EOP49_01370 [Sphingobacteriales bacterium]